MTVLLMIAEQLVEQKLAREIELLAGTGNRPQCYLVHDRTRTTCSSIEFGSLVWVTQDEPSELWRGVNIQNV
jgi:hypothetical protein